VDHLNPLTPEELDHSLKVWVKIAQAKHFQVEIDSLTKSTLDDPTIAAKSPLKTLSPFVDSHGILRVGGRLRNSQLTNDRKTPSILPRHSTLTKLVIQSAHIENLHAGPQLILAVINQQFVIIRARDAVRHQINKCVTCALHRSKIQQQLMGDLPHSRVNPGFPFETCGVDYA